MMENLLAHLRTYFLCLLRPYAVHDWLRLGILPSETEGDLETPTLASGVALSWVFAIVQGLGKIALASCLLQALYQVQLDMGLDFSEENAQLVPYYLLVFSTALDLVFFPVIALVVAQFWNLVVRAFGYLLGLTKDERAAAADQIIVVSLSSNFFLLLPILGVFLQKIAWFFLMYAGLRRNLQAGRVLSVLILFTPTLIMLMLLAIAVLAIMYLAMAGG